MEDHFCPNCGTEVEADARFCPTCGTILTGEGTEPELPPAPAWPPQEPALPAAGDEPTQEAVATERTPDSQPRADPQPAPEPEPPPPAAAASAGTSPPPAAPSASAPSSSMELPFTWPTMLSGWLIGTGSLLGAIFLIASLGNVVSLLLFLALIGIAATVFLADRIPDVPRQRLVILGTTMVGLGVGLARAGFTMQGADTLFLVAMLAAAGGALLIEVDRDRPMPPPEQTV